MNNDFFNGKLFSLDMSEIYELGEKSVEIKNVILGNHRKAIQTRGRGLDFELVFIGNNPISEMIEGYELQYRFKSENHAQTILGFCFFVSNKFPFNTPIALYNTFIDQMRSIFSIQQIEVITQADLNPIIEKYGNCQGTFASKTKLVYLRTFRESEVYQELFNFDKKSFVVDDDKQYVYLIFNEKNKYFKIGFSKNPLKREKTLQAEEPDIVILRIWERGRDFEKFLHKKYANFRVRGEWFKFGMIELLDLKEL